MDLRTLASAALLATLPVVGSAQTPQPKAPGPTPREVVSAPKGAVGIKVEWIVRYHHLYADIQADGRVGQSRVAYEWRDQVGGSDPVLIIGPSLQDTRFFAPAGSAI